MAKPNVRSYQHGENALIRVDFSGDSKEGDLDLMMSILRRVAEDAPTAEAISIKIDIALGSTAFVALHLSEFWKED